MSPVELAFFVTWMALVPGSMAFALLLCLVQTRELEGVESWA